MKSRLTFLLSLLILSSPLLAGQFSNSTKLIPSQVDFAASHIPDEQVGQKERQKSVRKRKRKRSALLKALLTEKIVKEDRQAKWALRLVLAGLISIGISSFLLLTMLLLILYSTITTFTVLAIIAVALSAGGFLSLLIGGFLGLAASNRLKKQGGEKADLKRANLAKGLGLAISAATILLTIWSLLTS